MPPRLLVIGGGIVGLEMATVYHELGAKITVVGLLDQLIPGADRDVVAPLAKRVSRQYGTCSANEGDRRREPGGRPGGVVRG